MSEVAPATPGPAVSAARSPAVVTFSVWQALFLREAVQRLFGSRAAWVWLLLEPIIHIAFLMLLYSTLRQRIVGGIDTHLWIMVGLLAFFVFMRTAHAMHAVGSNRALFSYRQVKPADTVLARAALEGILLVVIAAVVFASAGLAGLEVTPADPLAVLEAAFGLWLLGLGFALAVSVAKDLVPELGRVIGLVMQPLYITSGVILPLSAIPSPYREWLMFNPVAHGLEAARLAYAPYYQAVPDTSVGYLYICALVLCFFGLALHVRFATRLRAE